MIDKQSLLKDIGDFHTNCRRDYGKIEESTNKKILIGYLNKLFVLNLKKDIIGGKYDVNRPI